MKVLFQTRVDFFTKMGGDTVQALAYQLHLRELGICVEIVPEVEVDVAPYDLVHLFNIDRPLELYPQLLNAMHHKKKVVLSTIHHDHGWLREYDAAGRQGLLYYLNRILPSTDERELVKNILRVTSSRKLPFLLSLQQLKLRVQQQQRFVLEHVDAVIVLAKGEARSLQADLSDIGALAVHAPPERCRSRDSETSRRRDREISSCALGALKAGRTKSRS